MDKISKHISFKEATYSEVAKKKGIENIPTAEHIDNMKALAEFVFEPVRNNFNVPIFLNMYRSVKLNKKIGGAIKSQHCKGEAMDIDADVYGKVTNEDIFSYIKDNLEFDQLIAEGLEDGHVEWVHVSYKKDTIKNRKQVLIMYRSIVDNKKLINYLPYSEKEYKKFIKDEKH